MQASGSLFKGYGIKEPDMEPHSKGEVGINALSCQRLGSRPEPKSHPKQYLVWLAIHYPHPLLQYGIERTSHNVEGLLFIVTILTLCVTLWRCFYYAKK